LIVNLSWDDWGSAPNPARKLFEKSFRDFQKLLKKDFFRYSPQKLSEKSF